MRAVYTWDRHIKWHPSLSAAEIAMRHRWLGNWIVIIGDYVEGVEMGKLVDYLAEQAAAVQDLAPRLRPWHLNRMGGVSQKNIEPMLSTLELLGFLDVTRRETDRWTFRLQFPRAVNPQHYNNIQETLQSVAAGHLARNRDF